MDERYLYLLIVIDLFFACFIPIALACWESDQAWRPLERKITRRH